MGNMCCRRVGYSPNGVEVDQGRCHQQQQHQGDLQQKTMSNAYHNSGDDCAINELLEGRMDLDVILPDNRKVRLTVERRTPMMDLLVQAASATKISPAGHTIHVFGDNGKDSSTLQYKPSTPIGSLDANTICIVPKKDTQDSTGRRVPKTANRPFESTFRVQVHLPRNQLTVARVSPRVKISELRSMVCQEKGLDTSKYQLVRPSDRGQPLTGDMTLAEYGSTEITLLSNSCIESHICNSTSHIMPYSKRAEEQQKKTGILRLLAEDSNHKAHKKTLLNGTATHLRPAPTIKLSEAPHQNRYKPKKRRPAPPPPPPVLPEPSFHSRQSSSDSSGYHEATSSYLHEEHCVAIEEKASSDSSGVSSLDAKLQPQLSSVLNAKKRKAPPPPPVVDQKEPDLVKDFESEDRLVGEMPVEDSPPVNEVTADIEKEVETESATSLQSTLPLKSDSGRVDPCKATKDFPERVAVEGEAVTRVALVALNARIEQDVTQQEIASSIQAAFHSLDCPPQRIGPSLLAIKQRGGRTIDNGGVTPAPIVDLQEGIGLSVSSTSESLKTHDTSPSPYIPQKTSVRLTTYDTAANSNTSQISLSKYTPVNTTIKSHHLPKSLSPSTQDVPSFHVPSRNGIHVNTDTECYPLPSPNGVYLTSKDNPPATNGERLTPEGTHSDLYPLQKSSARLNLEQNDSLETFLPPPSEFSGVDNEASLIDEDPSPTHSTPSKVLRRSSSLLNLADVPTHSATSKTKRVRNLQRSLSDLSFDDKGEFEAEQERLQREYIKLQKQFILWQQQLMNNHAMLREECIVPQYARTLRQSHSLPEGEDYSDEAPSPIPLVSRSLSYEPTKNRCSTLPRSTINIPSLLELGSIPISNGSSTLRSSKAKSHFKPPQVRVSTKNRQRLPPEIRKDGDLDIYDDSKILSTILPSFDSLKLISENNDDDVDATVLRLKNNLRGPKLENLRNGCNGDGSNATVLLLKNNNAAITKLENMRNKEEVKKVPPPVPNKTSTFPKPKWGQNNGRIANGHSDNNLKCANGDIGQVKKLCDFTKVNGHAVLSDNTQPPPPPPLPADEKTKVHNYDKSNKVSGFQKKVVVQQVDPREELMQEIRRMGGRTALRKISLDITS